MFAIKYRGAVPVYGCLYEVNAAQLRAMQHSATGTVKVVSREAAKQWVKEGSQHSTPFYVDLDGKVQYARE